MGNKEKQENDDSGEERSAVQSSISFFLGEEDRGVKISLNFLSLRPNCVNPAQLYKQININMIIISSLHWVFLL